MATDWPISKTALRVALGLNAGVSDDDLLELYAVAACEAIDTHTGRDLEPNRHERTSGRLPEIFYLAAREVARLWWQQSRNGPRGVTSEATQTVPMGADLPARVRGWLVRYPARAGFGTDIEVTP